MKKLKLIKIVIIGFFTGFINGIFGSGGGTIIVPALTYKLEIEDHKSHATAIAIILPLSIISTIIYAKNNAIDFSIAYKVIIGGTIGSYIGARLLNKIPSSLLRKIFGIFLIIAAVRMIF